MLLYLIEKEVKQSFRDALFPFMIITLPLMSMFVFPFAANMEVKNIKVNVVDNDHSTLSRKMTNEIGASDYFNITGSAATYPLALEEVEADNADLIFEIPHDFERDLMRGEGGSVMISANAVNTTVGTLGSTYMMSLMSSSSALKEVSDKVMSSRQTTASAPSFSISPRYKFNPTLNYKVFMIPALLVMLLTILCGFFPALNIVQEKERGTIEQMNVTPVGKFQFILAKMIPMWVIGLIIFGFCIIAAYLAYGIFPAGSIWAMLLFTAVYIIIVSGMGLIVSNVASTMQQAMFIMFFFIMILLLLSGLFTPVSSMPAWAQVIASVNPMTYFIQVMRLVYLKGSVFADMIPQFLILCGFALAFGAAAVVSYRKTA